MTQRPLRVRTDSMNLSQSLLFFGIPGAAIYLALYVGVPYASAFGVPLIVSWTIGLWLPVVILLLWVLISFHTSSSPVGFRARFRLQRLTTANWVVIAVAFIVVQLCELGLSGSAFYLAQLPFFSTPPHLPELFDPNLDIANILPTFFGVETEGTLWLLGFWLCWMMINIGGEELLWRGYALPLQERFFGRFAWLINGLCWNMIIHAFMPWNMLTLLPISLTIPYLVQKYQNTWIGIYIHGFGNLLVFVLLVPSIFR